MPPRRQILEQRRMEEQEGKELKRICHEMDVDGSGTIQWDEPGSQLTSAHFA